MSISLSSSLIPYLHTSTTAFHHSIALLYSSQPQSEGVGAGAVLDSQELEAGGAGGPPGPPGGPAVGVGAPPPGAVAVTVVVGVGAGAPPPGAPAPGLTSWHRTSWPATGITQHLACWPVAAQPLMKSVVLAGVVVARP
jgi:hypothetical protein